MNVVFDKNKTPSTLQVITLAHIGFVLCIFFSCGVHKKIIFNFGGMYPSGEKRPRRFLHSTDDGAACRDVPHLSVKMFPFRLSVFHTLESCEQKRPKGLFVESKHLIGDMPALNLKCKVYIYQDRTR
jgi:hypothetical protein